MHKNKLLKGINRVLTLILCAVLITPPVKVDAATTFNVSTLEEADAAILASLNQHSTKMILKLDKNLDYYETYDLIVPYTRGLGTYNTHNFGYAVNGGTWTSLEINVRYYTSDSEELLLNTILDDLTEGWSYGSDFEKIKAAHDYICTNTVYSDKTANQVAGYDYHSAYDALVKHEAVCSGYALLFQKIMDKLGINSFVYVDENEVAHAWNIVNLDGNWYQIDCTWDDKASGFSYEYFLKGSNLKGHTYTGEIELSQTDYKPVTVAVAAK